ncbi:RHS repeat domain-containing protein [Sorangium sp. So ce341]|uniref:RHS repeat domain-containing protein n=1 Tax=Sorangium sp. So ce341 TaxID=3133302 RepID=UPI003F6462EB
MVLVNEARVLSLIDDQLGVVQRVVDERGETVLSASTTPFGALARDLQTASPGLCSTELVLGFTGQLRDPDTVLVHMGARDYMPALASFATPDPYALGEPEPCVRSPLECQPYAYAGHNPINFADESGLMMRNNAAGRQQARRSHIVHCVCPRNNHTGNEGLPRLRKRRSYLAIEGR